jgi:hypothetical protein
LGMAHPIERVPRASSMTNNPAARKSSTSRKQINAANALV